MKRPIEVEVFGQTLRVLSEDEEAYIRRVAEFVDGKMRELIRDTAAVSTLNVAILAALNIADEYHKLRRSQEEMIDRIERLSRDLGALED
jgi:cell division protein ZapA